MKAAIPEANLKGLNSSKSSSGYPRGKLEVIAGPMFAGKSSELLKRLLFLEHSGKSVLALKPHVDDRYDPNNIVTHNHLSHDALAVIDLELVKDNYTIRPYNIHTVFIDEVQFFDSKETCWFVEEGLREGVNFVCAGLDQDSRGVPFETTAMLLALADDILKITAFCNICGQTASKTQRLRNTGGRVNIGGTETYEPRCHLHWESK
jgi:thymidine kinase